MLNLVRKELIIRDDRDFAGQESHRFQHGLIRDAAYHGVLKRTRAELHERANRRVAGALAASALSRIIRCKVGPADSQVAP